MALVAARTAQGGPPPRVGDPFILRDDAQGRYLLYKGQTPRVSVWASTNLVDWARLENPAFVSPAFDRLAAQLLGMATNAPADAWYVSRTVRLPGRGVLRRSRAALPPGSALGMLLAFP